MAKDRLTQDELDELRDRAESGYGSGTLGAYELMRLLSLIEELQLEIEALKAGKVAADAE